MRVVDVNHNVKSRMKFKIGTILLAFLLISSCQSSISEFEVDGVSKDTQQLILNIRNSDVQWDGTFVGLMPKLEGPTLALQEINEPIESLLVEALLDKERYVAAHVLLTLRKEGSFTETVDAWNGLHVQLFADGSVTYEGNVLDALHQQWKKELAEKGK